MKKDSTKKLVKYIQNGDIKNLYTLAYDKDFSYLREDRNRDELYDMVTNLDKVADANIERLFLTMSHATTSKVNNCIKMNIKGNANDIHSLNEVFAFVLYNRYKKEINVIKSNINNYPSNVNQLFRETKRYEDLLNINILEDKLDRLVLDSKARKHLYELENIALKTHDYQDVRNVEEMQNQAERNNEFPYESAKTKSLKEKHQNLLEACNTHYKKVYGVKK